MLRRLTPSRTTIRSFAVGGAWFFIVVSLAHLMWAIPQVWGGGGTFKLYHTIVGEVSYDAWALTYTGALGVLLAILQLLVVAAATSATVLPWPSTVRYRRIGHGILCGWVALWTLNLIRLASIDGALDSTAQATLLCLLSGCTFYRATMGWSPGRSPREKKRMVGAMLSKPVPTTVALMRAAAPKPQEPAAPSWISRVRANLQAAVCRIRTTFSRVKCRLKAVFSAARARVSRALKGIAEFTRRQAERVSPQSGE